MTFLEKIDPELAPALENLPRELVDNIRDNPPAAREIFASMKDAIAAMLPPTDVTSEAKTISGPHGDVPLVIYQPPTDAPRPCMVWLHGGGYIIGSEQDDMSTVPFAEKVGCTIVSVGYRMAPEFTYKEATDDALAALDWTVENAASLGIDTDRIAIGGGSAGGGLAAAVALRNRDRGGHPLAFQLLIYPMIDDRHDTPSGNLELDPRVWNREVSLKAWEMYLGDEYGTDDVSPYGAPARAEDLSGLPPAYVTVGTMDLFRDEDITYAQRLMAAGVPTELEVFEGMFHGGEVFMPTATISQRMHRQCVAALKRALWPESVTA